jgi:hypothetical protein
VERKWKEEQNVERREIEKRRYMKWFRKWDKDSGEWNKDVCICKGERMQHTVGTQEPRLKKKPTRFGVQTDRQYSGPSSSSETKRHKEKKGNEKGRKSRGVREKE